MEYKYSYPDDDDKSLDADNKGRFFLKKYGTYENFRKEVMNNDYAKHLFRERIKFIELYQKSKTVGSLEFVTDNILANEIQIKECIIEPPSLLANFSFKYVNRYDEHILDIKEFIENLDSDGLDVKYVDE